MTTYSLDALLSQFWPVDCYMSGSNCCCLSCKEASHETGKVVCYSPVFKNLPQFGVIHTVKWSRCRRFSGILCFLSDPRNVGNLISSSSAFSISSLYIWKFSVHILLKPNLKDFEHDLASMWNECKCVVVWTFFGIGMKTDLVQSCGHCWVFQICCPIECSTFTALSFWIRNSSIGVLSAPLTLSIVMLPKAHLTSYSRMSGSMSDHT